MAEEQVTQFNLPKEHEFKTGDTIRVSYRISEGNKLRTQPFEGIVISKKGPGISKTFTVRRIGADGIGVERIFPLHSPNIEEIKVLKAGRVRRASIRYLRGLTGRSASRVKDELKKEEGAPKVSASS